MSKAKSQKEKSVTFSCEAPNATAVYLAGSFNDWDPEGTAMAEAAPGNWNVILRLAPGRYEYKFVVDGRWCCHPTRDDHDLSLEDCVHNSFGTLNRVIEIEV